MANKRRFAEASLSENRAQQIWDPEEVEHSAGRESDQSRNFICEINRVAGEGTITETAKKWQDRNRKFGWHEITGNFNNTQQQMNLDETGKKN